MRRLLGLLLICFVLVATCCGTVVSALAETRDVKVDLDLAKEGGEVRADVILTENDGINELYLRVEYDEDALELTAREFGSALTSLGPMDNFEEGGYEYPYRIIYADNKNVDDTGRLITLTFNVKDGAKDGEHSIKVVVRQVGHLEGELESVYNEKYGEPVTFSGAEDVSATTTGGLTAAEKVVVISAGAVDAIRDPENGQAALMIGLIVGGVVIFAGAIVIAYLLYRRKRTQKVNIGK